MRNNIEYGIFVIEARTALLTFGRGLSVAHSDMGKDSLATPLFERSLRLRERALGVAHVDVATSLNNLAVLLRKQGRYEPTCLHANANELRLQ